MVFGKYSSKTLRTLNSLESRMLKKCYNWLIVELKFNEVLFILTLYTKRTNLSIV